MTGVIYARYSCERQTENSILGQVRECRDFAKRNDIDIVTIYKDEAISGRTAEKRPSFMKMIRDASMHMFDCVIVWKGDRFSRSRADAAKYKSELKKLGIKVLSATEANVTGPEAVLMDGINEAFAEYFSVELAAKVERGMTQNAIDGRFNGGNLALGYKKSANGGIEIDEDYAFIIKEAFDLYANKDYSMNDIVRLFKEKGYRNRKGKQISNGTINCIIKNERYIGHYDFKGTVNNNMYPPIVDEETWKKAQIKAIKNKHERQKFQSKDTYFLSHKVFCGECEKPMTGAVCTSKSGRKFRYYKCTKGAEGQKYCKKTINKYDLEETVIDYLVDFIWNKSKIASYVTAIMEYFSKQAPDVDQYKKMIANTNRKIANVTDAIAEGGDRQLLLPKLNELKELLAKQQNEFTEINRDNDYVTKEYLETFLNGLKIKDYLTIEQKQNLIDTFLNRVYVYDKDGDIEIYVNYRGFNCASSDYQSVRLTNSSVHHY